MVYGKAVREIVAGNADGSILYAITASGVSRTRNGGRTWVAAGEVQDGQMVVALNDPDVLYAGGRGNCAISTSSTPMRRSTDGGLTWEEFVAGEGIEPLLVEADQNSKVVGTDCTLQVSVDGGLSFRFVPSTSGFDVSSAVVPDREVGDELLVIGTSEGGTSMLWRYDISSLVAPEPLGELARFYGLGAAGWSGGRIVLATSTGVGVSDDGGATWRWSRAGLEGVTYSVDPLNEPIPDAEQGRPFGFSVARIDESNPDRIYIGGALGAFRSADGGQTWARLGDESAVDSMVVATALDRVYVSADGGTRAWTLDGN